jgi:hypothetical protein
MSRKRGYLGGGTVIRAGSDWFAKDNEKTEKVHAQGKREGEINRARLLNKELAQKKEVLKELKKKSQIDQRQKQKAEINRAALIESGKFTAPPQPGTKAADYHARQDAKMEKVQLELRNRRKFLNKD